MVFVASRSASGHNADVFQTACAKLSTLRMPRTSPRSLADAGASSNGLTTLDTSSSNLAHQLIKRFDLDFLRIGAITFVRKRFMAHQTEAMVVWTDDIGEVIVEGGAHGMEIQSAPVAVMLLAIVTEAFGVKLGERPLRLPTLQVRKETRLVLMKAQGHQAHQAQVYERLVHRNPTFTSG